MLKTGTEQVGSPTYKVDGKIWVKEISGLNRTGLKLQIARNVFKDFGVAGVTQ